MNLKQTLAAGTIALAFLVGCESKSSEKPTFREGTYRGFPTIISYSQSYRRVTIRSGVTNLTGEDFDDDGRMDVVKISGPRGSALEEYTSISEVEKAYKEVSRNGH